MEIKAFLRALGASWQLMKKNSGLLWGMYITSLSTLFFGFLIATVPLMLLRDTAKAMTHLENIAALLLFLPLCFLAIDQIMHTT